MPQRRFPRPWRFEPIPGGYRVIDANGLALAHVHGEPLNAIAISDKRLTNIEAETIARLLTRLPELVELERVGTGLAAGASLSRRDSSR